MRNIQDDYNLLQANCVYNVQGSQNSNFQIMHIKYEQKKHFWLVFWIINLL